MLRGAISNKDEVIRRKTLESARKIVSEGDIPAFAELMVYEDLDVSIYGDPFPRVATEVFGIWRYMQPCDMQLEAAIQFRRLLKHQDSVILAVQKLVKLNKHLLESEYELAIKTATELVIDYGYSAAVIRKILFIYSQVERNGIPMESDESRQEIQDLMDAIFSQKRRRLLSLYTSYLIDLFDNRSSLFPTIEVQAKMNHRAISRNRDEFEVSLIEKTRFPCLPDTTLCNVSFYLFGCSSLVDVFIEFCCLSFGENAPSAVQQYFNESWAVSLKDELTEQHVSFVGRGPDGEDIDTEMYRIASVIPENKKLNGFRFSLDSQLVCREAIRSTGRGRNQSFFPTGLTIRDLTAPPINSLSQIDQFQNVESSIILRSFAVLFALNSDRDFTDLSAEEIRDLLGQTTGFSHTLTIDEVLQIRDRGNQIDSPIISFLALIMLNERDPNDDREFELRMAFQSLLVDDYNGNITEFLNWIYARTPGLCDSVVSLCDIAFLERLYLIYASYEDVLEQRQFICRWAFDRLGNKAYLDLAEQLEVDAKVREIRGELDDTRIYVEEMRYKQWAGESITPLLLRYQRQIEILGPSDTDPIVNKDKTNRFRHTSNASVDSDFHLYHALDMAFSEFCHNKTFGIDSYLSRRIRHGSLVGQLQAPIRVLVDEFIEAHRAQISAQEISELEQIYKSYSVIVHELKDEKLQFKSDKKPNGLFSSDALATASRLDVLNSFRTQLPQLFESGVTASMLVDVFPAICWSLLEFDLTKVREEIGSTFRSRVKQLLRGVKSISPNDTKWASLQNDIEQRANDSYNEILGWFYRPERSSMSVSISELAEVVKKEINGYHPEAPVDCVTRGQPDGTVSGTVYHTMYDIYFVLFDNAAKYADTSSPISIRADFVTDDDGNSDISVAVTTRIHARDDNEAVRAAIEASLADGALPNAMISEGKSGLGKMRWLIENYPKPGQFSWHMDEDCCVFEFSLPVLLVNKGVISADSEITAG